MATYKGVGYDSTSARVRTGTSGDAIEFASQVNATDSLVVTGTATVSTNLTVSGNASVLGNLDVAGDIISRGAVNLVVEDNFIDLNFANSTTTSESGGLTIQMNRTTGFTAGVVTTFVAGVNGVSNPTFTNTDGGSATLLVAGDIIVIGGATEASNDGLYCVSSVNQASFPQIVTIKGIGTVPASGSTPFVQTQFTADTGDTATVFCTDIAVWAVADGSVDFQDAGGGTYAKGTFITAYHADASESDFSANGGYGTASSTLQSAYEGGNDITTASSTDIDFTLTSGEFNVTTSDGNDFNVDGPGTFNIQTTSAANAANISHTGAPGADLAIQCTNGSLNLAGGEANAAAVLIQATNAAGGIDVNAGTAGFALDTTGVFSIDATSAVAASNINHTGAAGADLTVQCTNGSLNLSGGEANAAAVLIQAANVAGGIDINAGTAGVAIDATGASNFATTGGALTLTSAAAAVWSTTAGALSINGAGGVNIVGNSAEVDVTTTGALDLNSAAGTWDSSAGIALTGATASSYTTAAGALTLTSAAAAVWSTGAGALSINGAGGVNIVGNSAEVDVTTTGALDLNSAAGTWDSSAGIALTAATASSYTTAAGALTLTSAAAAVWSTGAGALSINGAAGVNIVGNTGEVDVTTSGALDLNSAAGTWDSSAGIALTAATASSYTTAAGALTLTAAAASTWSTGAGALTLDGAAGVNIDGNAAEVDVTTTGALDLNSAAGTWDASTLSLDSTDDTNLTMTANSGSLKTMTIAANNSGGGNGVLDIDAKTEIQIDSVDITMAATGGIVIASFTVPAAANVAAGDVLYMLNDGGVAKVNKADADAIATCRVVGVALATANLGVNCNVVTHGVMPMTADAAVAAAKIGTPVYASLTAGLVTTDTSSYTAGDVVYQIGHIQDASGGTGITVVLQPVFVMEIG